MGRSMWKMYEELVKLPFDEVQKQYPYMTYGAYQRKRLLFGIDKVIVGNYS